MRKALLMCALAVIGLAGCESFDGMSGAAAYDYNQPVQEGRYHPLADCDGRMQAEWKPSWGQPLTGEYPAGFRQPGGYAGAEGSRY